MIGITERGDPALDTTWQKWVSAGNPTILITKNPMLLHKYLLNILPANINIIVHCVITGFGKTKLEPGVPTADKSLLYYNKLIALLSADRVILRVDPVIPTIRGIATATKILRHTKTRVRISFIDNYIHLKKRFTAAGIRQLPWETFHAPLTLREEALLKLQQNCPTKIEICGEPGMVCNGCISHLDCKTLGVTTANTLQGQRTSCKCLSLKHELLNKRKQCEHGCLYCYWK
jgi:DNA repair photolyase